MSKVIADISMSLDGFVEADGRTPEEPMGVGGERLHEWFFDLGERAVADVPAMGAMVAGRRTYDASLRFWRADGPSGPARLPLIVVSHSVPDDIPANSVYEFAPGIEEGVALAKEAAGGQDVAIMGGAETICQGIRAGLVDELSIHLVPVLFGAGTRLFEQVERHVHLEILRTAQGREAVHLRFRVLPRER